MKFNYDSHMIMSLSSSLLFLRVSVVYSLFNFLILVSVSSAILLLDSLAYLLFHLLVSAISFFFGVCFFALL